MALRIRHVWVVWLSSMIVDGGTIDVSRKLHTDRRYLAPFCQDFLAPCTEFVVSRLEIGPASLWQVSASATELELELELHVRETGRIQEWRRGG